MIINEALCYVIHSLHASTVENCKRVLMNFYNENEIITAKKKLWDVVDTDHIGPYQKRNTVDRRPAKVEHVNDIVKAIQKLDSINLLPEFVAKDLDRIPSCLPEELNTLMLIQRVADLEKCRDEHTEIMTKMLIDVMNLQDGTRPINVEYKGQQSSNTGYRDAISRNPSNSNIEIVNNIPQIMITPPQPPENTLENAPSDNNTVINDDANTLPTGAGGNNNINDNNDQENNNERINGVGGNIPSNIEGTRWGPGATHIGARRNSNSHRPFEAQRRAGSGHRGSRSFYSSHHGGQRRTSHQGGGVGGGGRDNGPPPKPDPYQWNKVQKRSKRGRKVTYGNRATAGGLAGAPLPIRQIWVSRLHKGSIQHVKNYMKDNNVQVHNIEKVSHEQAKFSSYKISISVLDMDWVFDEAFWPNGVKCQVWRNRSTNEYDSDDESN